MQSYYAHIIATFEISGGNNEAQQWALDRLGAWGGVISINTTKWINPYENTAVITTRDGMQLGKYTVTVRMSVEAEGFADAQKKIVSALTEDPAVKYINIQSVNLTRA